MKPQYHHELMTSFFLWFDHELLSKGEAFSTKSGRFFYTPDSRLPDNYLRFQSDYKQHVNDGSITGNSLLLTGGTEARTVQVVYEAGGGDQLEVDSNDIIVDYENGGIISTGGALNSGDTVTAQFHVKDFNVYLTNDTEEDLILEGKFKLNSRFGSIAGNPASGGIEPYDQVTPAIFLNIEFSRNEGFALGGEDQTNSTIKAVVLADNEYQLDGALSIFADSARKIVPKIPFTGHPSTEYGDVKIFNGDRMYNYTGLTASYTDGSFFIDDVTVSKFSQRAQGSVPGDIKVGFIDFDISTQRFPRS